MNASADHPTQLSQADHRLLQALRARQADAIDRVQRAYGHELGLFCRRMLGNAAQAEDVVQDVFTKCCELESEALPTASLRGWLYQIARNRCIDLMRRRRETGRVGAPSESPSPRGSIDPVDPLTTPAGKALKRDRAARILAVLDEMDDDLRSVLVMKYFQDLSREEIADAIGLSVAGAKARLARAMEWLRERLSGSDGSSM